MSLAAVAADQTSKSMSVRENGTHPTKGRGEETSIGKQGQRRVCVVWVVLLRFSQTHTCRPSFRM